MSAEKHSFPSPEQSTLLNEQFQNNIKLNQDSFISVDFVINKIMTRGSKIIYSHYLNTKLPKNLSDYFYNSCTELVTHEIRPYDPGENIDSLLFNWTEDEEPEVPPLDSWGTYSVDVMPLKVQSIVTSNAVETLNSLAEPVHVNGRKSLVFQRNRSASNTRKIKLKQKELESEQAKCLKQEYTVEIQKSKEKKEEVVEDKNVEAIRKALEVKKKMRQLKIEEELSEQKKLKDLQDKIKTFEKQKKSHGFTFDYNGNVILMKKAFVAQEKAPLTYNLNKALQTIPKGPEEIPIRTGKDQNDQAQLSLVSSQQQSLKDKRDELSKTIQFRDIFNVNPGVSLKMNNVVKENPQVPKKDKMKREDFLQLLDNRRKENRDLKRFVPNRIQEDLEGEDQPKEETENSLIRHLKRLTEMNQATEIEIHKQDELIQMLMNNTGANQKRTNEKNKREPNKSHIEKANEGENEKELLETRVVNYNETGISEIKNRGNEMESKLQIQQPVSKIQQALDNYNRKLTRNKSWGQGMPRLNQQNPAPNMKSPPKVSMEKKTNLKTTIMESHVPKEPRERTTVGQKRVLQDKMLRINTNTPLANAAFPLEAATTKALETQHKDFIIRSSSNLKGRRPDSTKRGDNLQTPKTQMSQVSKLKIELPLNLNMVKSSASMTTVSKTIQTARARVNGRQNL